MTETQATPGPAGTATSPADSEGAQTPDGGAAGRAVVGRASVGTDGSAPKFTRAPGMTPPPDSPEVPAAADPPPVPPSGISTGRASVPAGARPPPPSTTPAGGRGAPAVATPPPRSPPAPRPAGR